MYCLFKSGSIIEASQSFPVSKEIPFVKSEGNSNRSHQCYDHMIFLMKISFYASDFWITVRKRVVAVYFQKLFSIVLEFYPQMVFAI